MNADWAKGRNERTGQEGIFPRTYVSILEEKNAGMVPPPPTPQQNNNYGNMPLTVSQSGAGGDGAGRSKFDENGKKFGKKLGNAGMFDETFLCLHFSDVVPDGFDSDFRSGGYSWLEHCQWHPLKSYLCCGGCAVVMKMANNGQQLYSAPVLVSEAK